MCEKCNGITDRRFTLTIKLWDKSVMDLQKESVYALEIFADAEGQGHINTHT